MKVYNEIEDFVIETWICRAHEGRIHFKSMYNQRNVLILEIEQLSACLSPFVSELIILNWSLVDHACKTMNSFQSTDISEFLSMHCYILMSKQSI